jgi:hypothetical protein
MTVTRRARLANRAAAGLTTTAFIGTIPTCDGSGLGLSVICHRGGRGTGFGFGPSG